MNKVILLKAILSYTIVLFLILWPITDISADEHDIVTEGQEIVVSTDDAFELAANLLYEGQWEAAFNILSSLLNRDPRAAPLLFEAGMTSITIASEQDITEEEREELLDVSIAAFLAILAVDPELTRVRLELARAFFLKGQDRLAKRQFERVLAEDLPDAVVANVNFFLAEIRARRRWNAYGGFGLAPDTNINAAPPEGSTTPIYLSIGGQSGQVLEFTADEKPTSGVGLSIWGGWEYQFPVSNRARLRFGADVSRREYKGREFDSMTLNTYAGPRFLISPKSELSVLLLGNRQWYETTPLFDDLGIRLEGYYSVSPRTLLSYSTSYRDRKWSDQSNRDGSIINVSFGSRFQVTQNLRLDTSLRWERNRPGNKNSRNKSYGLNIGVSHDLPRGFTIGFNTSFNVTRFDSNYARTDDGLQGVDYTTTGSVSISKRDFTIAGFSPRLTIGRTQRNTNRSIKDFTRSFAEIGFQQQF